MILISREIVSHADFGKVTRQKESLVFFDARDVLDDTDAENAVRIGVESEPEVISSQVFKGINSGKVIAGGSLL